MDVEFIKSKLRAIPDFPKKGILFQDIFGIFQDPLAVETLVTHIIHHITSSKLPKIDVVVGPLIALRLGAAFVPVRKKGKLPGLTISAEYVKEYGTDVFEMQLDAIKPGQNVIVLDDLIATGGSASAAGQLARKCGGVVAEYIFFIELTALKGAQNLDAPVYSVLKFDD
ncbi:adenine phosphoribosyltransferase [Phlyctochytrium bullatum]|nr:adenine phosphoribosyltransferase [Phlyctochytrium bullatum]